MSAIEYRNFWSVPVEDVPQKTGAADVMDCSDIRDVVKHLKVKLDKKAVLDVGCGTGRVSQLCGSWTGVDVSPAAVAYCLNHGLRAEVVQAPIDLVGLFATPWGEKPFDTVVCLSVFTHVSRSTRRAYLAAFHGLADELVVDILPGDEGGSIAAWYADPADFVTDVSEGGWTVERTYERVSSDGERHLYHYCR